MRDGFAAIGSVIDDNPKPGVIETVPMGQVGGGEEEVSEQGGLFRGGRTETGNERLGDDEGVKGSLRIDITDGDAAVILMKDVGGDLPGDDFFK